ncbi:MAG TPA: SH3 domain-containing protein, partial [Longimicrobiales bacterium]|nr:SH3 domain-containing protein [Longimicrobiales bacterium]
YRSGEGAIDPVPFLDPPRGRVVEVSVDLERLGTWVRARGESVRLRAGPDGSFDTLRELPRHTALRVLAASGNHYRVRVPDGTVGWVAAPLVEPLEGALASRHASTGEGVLARPLAEAPLIALLEHEADLPVLGVYESFVLVEAPGGIRGWLAGAPGVAPAAAVATEEQ